MCQRNNTCCRYTTEKNLGFWMGVQIAELTNPLDQLLLWCGCICLQLKVWRSRGLSYWLFERIYRLIHSNLNRSKIQVIVTRKTWIYTELRLKCVPRGEPVVINKKTALLSAHKWSSHDPKCLNSATTLITHLSGVCTKCWSLTAPKVLCPMGGLSSWLCTALIDVCLWSLPGVHLNIHLNLDLKNE